MERLGVGIIGFHHLHSLDYLPHFDAIARAEVRAVAEADPAYLKRVCGQTGIEGYGNYNTLLAREDIGLAVILLPHAECPDAVERAAEAGKHVIVEKPMADTSGGIRRMIAATEAAGVALTSPYCWRAHPASRKIKELVDRGFLGQIVALEGAMRGGLSPAVPGRWHFTLAESAVDRGGRPDAQPGNPLDRSVQMDPSGRSRTGDRHGEPPAASPGH